jgi:hypothetical protein
VRFIAGTHNSARQLASSAARRSRRGARAVVRSEESQPASQVGVGETP